MKNYIIAAIVIIIIIGGILYFKNKNTAPVDSNVATSTESAGIPVDGTVATDTASTTAQ